jgi:hypothetical protein
MTVSGRSSFSLQGQLKGSSSIEATSNAPRIGRKRRLSADEEEEEDAPPTFKRPRGTSDHADASSREQTPVVVQVPAKDTAEVKEVTKGVKHVDLEDTKGGDREGGTARREEEEEEGDDEAKVDTASAEDVQSAALVEAGKPVKSAASDIPAVKEPGCVTQDVKAENVPLPAADDEDLENAPSSAAVTKPESPLSQSKTSRSKAKARSGSSRKATPSKRSPPKSQPSPRASVAAPLV